MIIDDIDHADMIEDRQCKTDRYQAMVYPIAPGIVDHVMSNKIGRSVTFLFSGSWRLDVDATYLELRHFRSSYLAWHSKTLFVEPQDLTQYRYVLNRIRSDNLIILHSDYWCGHRPIEQIIADLEDLRKFTSRVICSLPIQHSNFNRLTTGIQELCQKHAGMSACEDSLILVR